METTVRAQVSIGGLVYVTRLINVPDLKKVTKWDLLSEGERTAAEETPFTNGGCVVCKEELPTEAAFAKHFVIDDLAYPNLGHCPKKEK